MTTTHDPGLHADWTTVRAACLRDRALARTEGVPTLARAVLDATTANA